MSPDSPRSEDSDTGPRHKFQREVEMVSLTKVGVWDSWGGKLVILL